MPMETRHDLEHTTERLTEGLRCPWKWGLCGHVKLSLLNSAAYPEYPDRKVGVRACATSSASCELCPRQSFHSKGSD